MHAATHAATWHGICAGRLAGLGLPLPPLSPPPVPWVTPPPPYASISSPPALPWLVDFKQCYLPALSEAFELYS